MKFLASAMPARVAAASMYYLRVAIRERLCTNSYINYDTEPNDASLGL
jgi:hypothetical protein